MTQYLTRREMREAERSGKPVTSQQVQVEETPPIETAPATYIQAEVQPAEVIVATSAPAQPLSRRELRLLEAGGQAAPEQKPVEALPQVDYSERVTSEPIPVLVPEVILAAIEEVTAENEISPTSSSDEPSTLDFTGSNLLAEPSTQSIVLDIAPEAISLPLDTLDGASTGSISILPDPNTGALTGALDGLVVDNADRVDAVTGVITMVDPVSAMDVINQRVTMAVVPDEALRKNWWQAWAYGALGVGLAVATIVATIAIISAVGE
jgi:hypothetical protein